MIIIAFTCDLLILAFFILGEGVFHWLIASLFQDCNENSSFNFTRNLRLKHCSIFILATNLAE
jgi:hypothetical protein